MLSDHVIFILTINYIHVKICLTRILKLREVAKRFLKFKVGDGSRIFLWLDDWHLDGCLLDKYGHRVVYDARELSWRKAVDYYL
jgi:hypothetical protein